MACMDHRNRYVTLKSRRRIVLTYKTIAGPRVVEMLISIRSWCDGALVFDHCSVFSWETLVFIESVALC